VVSPPAPSQPPEPAAREFAAPATEASYVRWPPPPPKREPSARRTLTIIASVLAGSVLLAVLCAGAFTFSIRAADGDLRVDAATTPAPARTLVVPTATAFNGIYRMPGRLCDSGDFTRMHPLVVTVDHLSETGPSGQPPTMVCDGNTTTEGTHGAFRLTVTIYPSASDAIDVFKADPMARATPVAHVGQGAYESVDGAGLHTVTAIDFNLIMTMTWHLTAGDPPASQDVLDTLAAVEASTLRVLRFS
jgi:hypothetical protein